MKSNRMLALISLLIGTALLAPQRTAQAQSDEDYCRLVDCSQGGRKCAELSGSIPDERCEEGAMCCPFPEDWFFLSCFESAT